MSATTLDPMGATGTATELGSVDVALAPKTDKKPRAPKAPDTDAPRRKGVVNSVFAEAVKAKYEGITDPAKLIEAQRTAALKNLLLKAEGKDGIKFKSTDFDEVKDFGGKKAYWHMRKMYFTAKVQECQDKIDGKKTADPEAQIKKAFKMKNALAALMKDLEAEGVDLSMLGNLG